MTEFQGKIGDTIADSEPWWPPVQTAPEGSPNVVMIVLDDVGFAQLGCYGSSIRTPNLDRLAGAGLRYTNFHTTPLCSPTRACLLTGRNHHAVGMGSLANFNSGFPGSTGEITHRAATIAEMLGSEGYNTMAVGKWHLVPADQQSPAGPYDQWPLQRGFERYYGFIDAWTSQWNPELTCDNHRIEAPEDPDYHLTEDLVDRSISYLREQISWAPSKPFFLYLAFGACHDPHHAPASYIDGYRGEFDRGWDVCREEWLAEQKRLGIVPADTVLPPRNPGVQAWADLSADERRLFARYQEAFAGMLEHVDFHIGRLLDFLDATGRRENTMVIVVSDNGASSEGTAVGTGNIMRVNNEIEDTVAVNLAEFDKIGTPEGWNLYPLGWAMAGNTPCRWYKFNTHGGGIRDPLIVSWPRGIEDGGGLRHQFHHATDIVPTLLEVTELEAPSSYRGVEQMPIEGVSMAYTFADAEAPTRKDVQYFEMLGERAIYADGWKAVTHHLDGVPFDQDRWELYDLSRDFAEADDLAEQEPERLRSMIELWWEQARRHRALPLDDRIYERFHDDQARPGSIKDRDEYTLYRGIAHVGFDVAPDLKDVSHSIAAELDRSDGGEGVILAHGGNSGGYSLYVKEDRLVYHYNYAGERFRIASEPVLPQSPCAVRMEFEKTGRCKGRVRLFCDEEPIGEGELPKTLSFVLSIEGMDVGADRLTPVADEYESPFSFSGEFESVRIRIGDDRARDLEGELRSSLGRQ